MTFQSALLAEASNTLAINNISKESPESYNISPLMLNPDEEPVIEINSDLRKISIPDELKNIAVAGDHLSETIYFHMPRYFDGDDLSNRDCLIRFINAGNEYGESDVCNIEIFDDYIKFGWAIDNNATRYSGILTFTVQFETVQNGIEYQWQTTPAELNILAGLNIESTITDKDDVLFRTLTYQIQDLRKSLLSIQSEANKIPSLKSEIAELTKEVNYLKNNVVYVLTE